jgi:hypothetical protein
VAITLGTFVSHYLYRFLFYDEHHVCDLASEEKLSNLDQLYCCLAFSDSILEWWRRWAISWVVTTADYFDYVSTEPRGSDYVAPPIHGLILLEIYNDCEIVLWRST